MKKRLFLCLVLVMLVLATGCGNKKVIIDDKDEKTTNSSSSTTTTDSEIELYSDDTKIVFKNGNNKVVFYYKGDKITAYHAYLDYGTKANAELVLKALDNEADDSIKKAYVKGRYVVVEYKEEEYENLTVSEVRTVYSYLEEIKKK